MSGIFSKPHADMLEKLVEDCACTFFDHYCGTHHHALNTELGEILHLHPDYIDVIINGVIKGLVQAQKLSGEHSYYGSPIKMMENIAVTKLEFQPDQVGGCVVSTPVEMPIYVKDAVASHLAWTESIQRSKIEKRTALINKGAFEGIESLTQEEKDYLRTWGVEFITMHDGKTVYLKNI
jgi:hypothetical protein